MTIGMLFSLCAGILIGIKLYYRFLYREKIVKPVEDITETKNEESVYQKYEHIIDTERYIAKELLRRNGEGSIVTYNGEPYAFVGNRYVKLETDVSKREKFWNDLWYGSGGNKSG